MSRPHRLTVPRRAIAAALTAVTVAGAAAAPVLAHAPVDARTPAPGSTPTHVSSVQVRFGEAVVTGLVSVRRGATAIRAAATGLKPADHAILRARFAKPLARGRYTVSWRALADDGHHEAGTWTFTVR
jgi:copper resistance protein C